MTMKERLIEQYNMMIREREIEIRILQDLKAKAESDAEVIERELFRQRRGRVWA